MMHNGALTDTQVHRDWMKRPPDGATWKFKYTMLVNALLWNSPFTLESVSALFTSSTRIWFGTDPFEGGKPVLLSWEETFTTLGSKLNFDLGIEENDMLRSGDVASWPTTSTSKVWMSSVSDTPSILSLFSSKVDMTVPGVSETSTMISSSPVASAKNAVEVEGVSRIGVKSEEECPGVVLSGKLMQMDSDSKGG